MSYKKPTYLQIDEELHPEFAPAAVGAIVVIVVVCTAVHGCG